MLDIKIGKAVLKGLATYIPGYTVIQREKKKKSRHSAANALFCYTFWLGLLKYLHVQGIKPEFENVGELGTAGSVGIGLCALLTGCKRYYALEIEDLYESNRNKVLLDELVKLFRAHTPLSLGFSQLNLPISDQSFPHELIQPMYQSDQYIESLSNELDTCINHANPHISYLICWDKYQSMDLDFVYSRAVMEHVKSPDTVYQSISRVTKASGLMFHDIELHSHGITTNATDHRKIPPYAWKAITGKRKYFLNQFLLEDHVYSIEKNFKILDLQPKYVHGSIAGQNKEPLGAVILAKKF